MSLGINLVSGLRQRAEDIISSAESPFFHYLRYLLLSITNFVQAKKATDINLRLEQNVEGQDLKELSQEIASKRLVLAERASLETLQDIRNFIAQIDIEEASKLSKQSLIDKAKRNNPWKQSITAQVNHILQIDKDDKEGINITTGKKSKKSNPKTELKNLSNFASPRPVPNEGEMNWNLIDNFSEAYIAIKDNETTNAVDKVLYTENSAGEDGTGLRLFKF